MIYHVIKKDVWDKEKDDKGFGTEEIKKFGFIHSSTEEGLKKIMKRFEDDMESYLLLCIDEEAIKDKIRYEEKDNDHLFPHFTELIDVTLIKDIITLKEYLDSSGK